MREWSKLKKIVVVSAVSIFALAGIGALTSSSQQPQTTKSNTPSSQASTSTQPVLVPVPATQSQAAPSTTSAQSSAASSTQNCDPNYSGACVPNVYPSDVDCAGGSGNGPYYVQGPVHVIGTDRYGLDRDGDGVACE